MCFNQSREIIPPPSRQEVRNRIEMMFTKNKKNPVTATSIASLHNIDLSVSPQRGGCEKCEDKKLVYPTQHYKKYDSKKCACRSPLLPGQEVIQTL